MKPSDKNRAWLQRIEEKLAELPRGDRNGSVTLHFTESGDTAVVRELEWRYREKSLDPASTERVLS